MFKGRTAGATAALAVILIATGCSSTTHSTRQPARSSPTTDVTVSGCTTNSGVVPAVPLIPVDSGAGPVDTAPICIDGQGPYRFVVDTSSARSAVRDRVAAQLHLPAAPNSLQKLAVGCSSTDRQVTPSSMSLGPVALSSQPLAVLATSDFGSARIDGVLGGDILSRFGAVRLDYRSRLLTPLAPEGRAPSYSSILKGNPGEPPPPLLVHGTGAKQVILTVSKSSQAASISLTASFHNLGAYPFIVNTGSPRSSIASDLVKSLGLPAAGNGVASPGLGCRAERLVESGTWSIGQLSLPAERLVSSSGQFLQPGVGGAIGSDLLSSYGSVVIDYRTGLLWLGAG